MLPVAPISLALAFVAKARSVAAAKHDVGRSQNQIEIRKLAACQRATLYAETSALECACRRTVPRMSDNRPRMSDEPSRRWTYVNSQSGVRKRRLVRHADVVANSDGNEVEDNPYRGLLSVLALGDAVGLCISAAACSVAGNAPLTAALYLSLWAAVAPLLGAFADAKKPIEALKAPALALGVTVSISCLLSGPLQGQAPAPQFCFTALLVASALIEGWRLIFFAIRRTDRALNAFVLAVKDEDGGDEDF